MTKYAPKPLDTSTVDLTNEQARLVDDLARNVHEVWAAKRMAAGWTLGPERSDALKQHPCLVAYEDLPEEEKDYDRSVVEQTIKSMLALGFRIERD